MGVLVIERLTGSRRLRNLLSPCCADFSGVAKARNRPADAPAFLEVAETRNQPADAKRP
jgi:hypothetical protein